LFEHSVKRIHNIILLKILRVPLEFVNTGEDCDYKIAETYVEYQGNTWHVNFYSSKHPNLECGTGNMITIDLWGYMREKDTLLSAADFPTEEEAKIAQEVIDRGFEQLNDMEDISPELCD